MGVVSLFPSNVECVNTMTQDEMRSFETVDGVRFVYLICGPLYLLAVARTAETGETAQQIRNALRYLHCSSR